MSESSRFAEAIAHLRQADPILAASIDQVGACLLAPTRTDRDLFASLASAIVSQQLSSKAASTIWGRFAALYPHQPYPPASGVLETPDEVLRSVGLSRQKIGYLKDLAQRSTGDLPTLEQLHQMDDEAIIAELTKVKGLGRWTVQMLLMFQLERPDVLPVDDLGIRSAIRTLYALSEMPSRQQVEACGRPWAPYRSVACWYLWRSLDPR